MYSNEWDFLEKTNQNLLYNYAEIISGKKKQIRLINNKQESEYERLKQTEEKRKTAYYLIWFVFYYILNCKTLEEAKIKATRETLKKFHLLSYVLNGAIYIGNGLDKELCIIKMEDVPTVLEILYNRYNLFEQIECYIRNSKKIKKKRGILVLEKYKDFYKMYKEK